MAAKSLILPCAAAAGLAAVLVGQVAYSTRTGGGSGVDGSCPAGACPAGQRAPAGPLGVSLLQARMHATLARSAEGASASALQWPTWPAWPPVWPAPTQPPAPPEAAPLPDDVPIRLAAFNVYYAELGLPRRMEGIAEAISQMGADIAVITEQWNEKPGILERVRQKSGRNYTFCDSGDLQEETWDGDILYDQDLWEALEDGVQDLGRDRGLSWAVLRHRASGKKLLVYGIHPLCCGNEEAHLRNAEAFAAHAQARSERPDTPIVIMGDFNALEDWDSTQLYQGHEVHAFGRDWQLPFGFDDAFRVPPANWYIDGTTHSSGSRLDYIFTERRSPPAFRTSSSSIWRSAPGGSDHYPIIADVVLRR